MISNMVRILLTCISFFLATLLIDAPQIFNRRFTVCEALMSFYLQNLATVARIDFLTSFFLFKNIDFNMEKPWP